MLEPLGALIDAVDLAMPRLLEPVTLARCLFDRPIGPASIEDRWRGRGVCDRATCPSSRGRAQAGHPPSTKIWFGWFSLKPGFASRILRHGFLRQGPPLRTYAEVSRLCVILDRRRTQATRHDQWPCVSRGLRRNAAQRQRQNLVRATCEDHRPANRNQGSPMRGTALHTPQAK
jgi:hypothetical protein